tara:strand:+ start:1448 stop:1762 length:315 start_codon:yes stop_codon:yes gene_type:complete
MNEDNYIVIEGTHKNPNRIETLEEKTKKIYGPFNKLKAKEFAKGLIQKNVDNFYHRAWVIKKDITLDKVCEECKQERDDVIPNLILFGFKICGSCKISKTIFPI